MPVDPSVIAALETAVAAAPENAALRLHLATLLLDAARARDALEQCAELLARAPDHLDALALAAKAADAVGERGRADSYRRVRAALGAAKATTAGPGASGPASTASATEGEVVELDAGGDQHDDEGDEEEALERATGAEGAEVIPFRVIAGGGGNSGPAMVETSRVTLADVAGMADVKRRLELAFLAPLRNPALVKAYGKTMRGGLLLYGPPGCGKTYIARALAGELGARFIAVGLADVLDMWLGQSERNLHEIFATARRAAPCVLFFDEVDALGRKRALQRHSAGANVVNQLLAELDGVGADNTSVFVLAATNHPWDVDAALRRPGRFDRTVLVLPPDAQARAAILEFHLRDRPLERDVNVAALAKRTEDFSGADLSYLCQAATELAMEESLGGSSVKPKLPAAPALRALKQPVRIDIWCTPFARTSCSRCCRSSAGRPARDDASPGSPGLRLRCVRGAWRGGQNRCRCGDGLSRSRPSSSARSSARRARRGLLVCSSSCSGSTPTECDA